MEIRISEQEILSGDISQLKTIIENYAHDDRLSTENEDKIVIKFNRLTPLDLSLKLQNQQYKAWFKKIDSEFPYIPFFLNRQSKTLMFFILGNIDFTIEDQNIVVNESSKQHYIADKKASVKAFCLTHNIDMAPTLHRLTFFEPEHQQEKMQKVRVDELLSKRGTAAYMSEQREYTISIFLKEIPKDLKIHAVYYTEFNCPQPFFSVFMEQDGERIQYTVYPQIAQRDTDEYLSRTHEVKILIVFKINDQLKGFPKITENIKIVTLEELKKQQELFLYKETISPSESNETPVEPEEKSTTGETVEEKENTTAEQPEETEDLDKTLPVQDVEKTSEANEKIEKNEEEIIPENETLEEKVVRLEKEVAHLREKTVSQKKIIEDLEEEINKKRSIWSIIKRLFS